MQAYTRLLIAIDLEYEAEIVINKALAISSKDCEIDIVYVVTPISDALYANGLGLVSPMLEVEGLQQEAINAAKQRLSELVSHFPDFTIQADVLVGDTVSTIVNEAVDRKSQVIVLGSHGKKGLQLLLGSTASGVLHHAKCDTLAVRL